MFHLEKLAVEKKARSVRRARECPLPCATRVAQRDHGRIIHASRLAGCPVLVIDLVYWGERVTVSACVPSKMSWLTSYPACVLAYDDQVLHFSMDGVKFVDGMLRLRMFMHGPRPEGYLSSTDSKTILIEFQRVLSCSTVEYSYALEAFHSWWSCQSRELLQAWQKVARVATHSRISHRNKKNRNSLVPETSNGTKSHRVRRYTLSDRGVHTFFAGKVLMCDISTALGMGMIDFSQRKMIKSKDCVDQAVSYIARVLKCPGPVSQTNGVSSFLISHYTAPRGSLVYRPFVPRHERRDASCSSGGFGAYGNFRSSPWRQRPGEVIEYVYGESRGSPSVSSMVIA